MNTEAAVKLRSEQTSTESDCQPNEAGRPGTAPVPQSGQVSSSSGEPVEPKPEKPTRSFARGKHQALQPAVDAALGAAITHPLPADKWWVSRVQEHCGPNEAITFLQEAASWQGVTNHTKGQRIAALSAYMLYHKGTPLRDHDSTHGNTYLELRTRLPVELPVLDHAGKWYRLDVINDWTAFNIGLWIDHLRMSAKGCPGQPAVACFKRPDAATKTLSLLPDDAVFTRLLRACQNANEVAKLHAIPIHDGSNWVLHVVPADVTFAGPWSFPRIVIRDDAGNPIATTFIPDAGASWALRRWKRLTKESNEVEAKLCSPRGKVPVGDNHAIRFIMMLSGRPEFQQGAPIDPRIEMTPSGLQKAYVVRLLRAGCHPHIVAKATGMVLEAVNQWKAAVDRDVAQRRNAAAKGIIVPVSASGLRRGCQSCGQNILDGRCSSCQMPYTPHATSAEDAQRAELRQHLERVLRATRRSLTDAGNVASAALREVWTTGGDGRGA